jgi:Leucine-rich repeat (LRR) protein
VFLQGLRDLDLRNNHLKSLSPKVALLTNLRKLDLYQNELSSLPKRIHSLSNLIELYLGKNKLPENEQLKIKTWFPKALVSFQ